MTSARSRPTWRFAALIAAATLALSTLGGASVAQAETSFTFRGGGWGHGVGMSQYGACGMASQGSSAATILAHYYQGTAVTGMSEASNLRVLLRVNSNYTLTAGGTTTFSGVGTIGNGATVNVSRSGNNIVLSGALSATVAAPLTVSMSGSPLRVTPPGNRFNRGKLVLRLDSGGGLRAIVENLSARDFLLGLGEMPSSWPAEALKTQAIAGRTIAQAHAGSGGDYDLNAQLDGAYIGWDKEGGAQGSSWISAVDATSSKVVTYNGALILAPYSSSSGGYTANVEAVWVATLPYLRAVSDPADSGCNNANHSWSTTFGATQLGQKLGMGPITAIAITVATGSGSGPSGRLDKASVKFTDSSGNHKSFSGAELRTKLGLRSTKFVIDGATGNPTGGSGPPSGTVTDIRVHDERKLLVAGTASDPDGAPRVFIADLHEGNIGWRVTQSVNGYYLDVFDASPGKHTTCAAVLDTPSDAATMLGCRENIVK